MSWMFKLRGTYSSQQGIIFGFIGFLVTLMIWIFFTSGGEPIVPSGILPTPAKVLGAFGDLMSDNELFKNLCLSLGYNFGGYIIALAIALPFGFLIGLYPVLNAAFKAQVDAIRFIPLTAITGLFIVAFGIGASSKINFLAFGIIIYLTPIIVQRISEVSDVFLKTVYTIGATDWQTIRTVYMPAVLSKLSDDIRVLTAISWTYIIVAEGIASQGGLGSLIYNVGRKQGRPDKTFAILIIFILIGLVQDRLFVYLDKRFFPHKYQIKEKHSSKLKKPSVLDFALDFGFMILGWVSLGVYLILALNEFLGFLEVKPLSYLFADTVWVIHTIFISILIYKVWCIVQGFNKRKPKVATNEPVS